MSKHRDYKTADAPKTEPLKTGLGDFIKPDHWKRLAEQIAPAATPPSDPPDGDARGAAYERLARSITAANEVLAEANESLREGGERFAAYEKEETP